MLVNIRTDDPTRAIDIYPHAQNEQEAVFQARFTVMYSKIYYQGNEWTIEAIQREKERVQQLEAAFLVAQMVIECENKEQ